MIKTYDWQRYWYKGENDPRLFDGFLYVHEYITDVFTLDSVSDVSCLVLKGEPGMGKSKEIERICKNQIEGDSNRKLYFNLSTYGEEGRLVKDVFESDKIKQWKESSGNLYLFLDSLDEALLSINPLTLLLADEIGKLPKERLFIRIACRTAEWSNHSVLENKLKELWKEDSCQILQIAPLQQKDVESAAKSENLDSAKFISELYNKNVSALASKPVTLQFLLDLFRKNGSFPSTQTELYEKGILTLCEEKNERRKAAKRVGILTPEQRFLISARIAALMIFGNKSSIWLSAIASKEKSDILISELSDYTDKSKNGIEFQVSEDYVREVISDTGLFTDNGNNRLKFSHQTFVEFLASWYLEHQNLSDEALIEIIGKDYLYPQLYETSAWVANQRKSIFQHLMKIAPATLLRSDILLAEDSTKAKLVEILLELFDREELDGIDRRYYYKLKHPKLAEQIHPYITDKTKNWLVRTEAIDMAQVCKVEELQKDFAEIALDNTDDQYIRVRAVYAIDWLGDFETKRKLRPLAFGTIEEDERFQLKGAALYILWSDHLTAKELFSVLSPPNNFHIGRYESFLDSKMIEKLKVEDLPIALDWLAENLQNFIHGYSSEKGISDEILLMAWENLDNKEIFEKFIKVVKQLIAEYKDIFQELKDKEKLEQFLQDNNKRHKIWLEIFSSVDENHYWTLNESRFIGIRSNDIDWLAQEWENTKNGDLKDKLLSVLKSFVSYWQMPFEDLDEICRACNKSEKLEKEFEKIFAARELNSESAKEEKKLYEEHTKYRRERAKKDAERNKLVNPSPMELTIKCLEKIENGNTDSFIELNYQMMFPPNGYSNKSEFESDLTKYPVWGDATEDTRTKISEAAKQYLEKGNPKDNKWIGSKSFYYSALSGYKALSLVNKIDPEFLNNLEKEKWEKWAAIIYHYPKGNSDKEYEEHRRFVAKTYSHAPHRIIELLKGEIESETEDKSYWGLERLKYCWDARLRTFLRDELKNANLSTYGVRKILSELLEQNDDEAQTIGCNLIKYPIPDDEKGQEIVKISIELLITYEKINCWEKIWHVLENDPDFGKSLIEYACYRFRREGKLNLSEKQLADLYLWISKYYPHEEDPVHHGNYNPNVRDAVKDWRESILNTLVEKGTSESVNEVKRIKEALPEVEWLKRTILRAEEKRRTMSWEPFSPNELTNIIHLDRKNSELKNLEEELSDESITIKNLNSTAEKKGKRRAGIVLGAFVFIVLSIISISIYYSFTLISIVVSIIFFLVPAIVSIIKGKEWTFSKATEQFIESEKKRLYLTSDVNLEKYNISRQKLEEIKAEVKLIKT